MKRRRGKDRETELCSGPAKLADALAIDRSLDGTDLATSDVLYVRRSRKLAASMITATPRIGVDYAKGWSRRRLRFFAAGNPNVSRP